VSKTRPSCPELSKIEEIREPIITTTIFVPQDYLGNVITLCNQKRGNQVDMTYHGRQVQLVYEMPMAEVVMDFFDRLKSVSRGYASLDYDFKEYRAADVVKLDVLINGERVDALSVILHRANSVYRGRELAAKMRELIPRQMYDVAIQAAIGANIIARENVKAMRKDVTRQVLRRRHHAQEETAREAEGRQEAHEAGRVSRDSTGGFPCCVACRQVEESEPVNFALILLILLLVSGAIWAADALVLRQASSGRRQGPVVGRVRGQFFPGHSGRLHAAFVSRRAVQDSLGLDDSHLAGRRFHSGQQVHLWHPSAGGQLEDHRHQQPATWRRDGLSLSRGSLARLHQAGGRPPR
jgi:hypothetical protein